jgi:hypothetical protein
MKWVENIVTWCPKVIILESGKCCRVLCSSLLKHVSVAMNMHIAIEELLGSVVSNQSAPKLYKAVCQGQSCQIRQGGELYDYQSCETVKYGHESCGSQNQEWLFWLGPAVNLPVSQSVRAVKDETLGRTPVIRAWNLATCLWKQTVNNCKYL